MEPAQQPSVTATSRRDRPVVLVHEFDDELGPLAGFSVRRPGRRDRALARWRGFALDARLAAGSSPDGEHLLAVRALVLVRPTTRERLARNWEHVLEVARARPSSAHLRAPLCRDRILAAEPEIQRLVLGLRAGLPVPARGVAMASHLLTDGAGPLHNRRSPVDLRAALEAAAQHMDPSDELMAPTRSVAGES
jgi:hypothetical protein